MQGKLDLFTRTKKEAVRGQDMISMGLGILGGALLAISVVQPKSAVNALRVPLSVAMFAGSVIAERIREEHLESMQNALGYQKSIDSERIKRDTFHLNTLKDLQEELEVFQAAPKHLWPILADKLGYSIPPEKDQFVATSYYGDVAEPSVDTGYQSNVALQDPSADYDPEESESKGDTSNCSVIFAAQVKGWMEANIDLIPESLAEAWKSSPGYAIEINDGKVKILRSENA